MKTVLGISADAVSTHRKHGGTLELEAIQQQRLYMAILLERVALPKVLPPSLSHLLEVRIFLS